MKNIKFLSEKRKAEKSSVLYLPEFLKKPWVIGICILLLFLLPFIVNNTYVLHVINLVLYYIILSVSLDLQVGFLGLINFGQVGFAAIGSYTVGILTTRVIAGSAGFWIALVLGAVFAGIVGLLVGLTTYRIRGDFFCIVTLGFGEVMRYIALNWIPVTNGPMGISGVPSVSIMGSPFSKNQYYWLVLVLALFTVILALRLKNSYIGRAWIAMREDSLAAESMGVNLVRYKVLNIGISAALAGLAGGFFAAYLNYVSPMTFTSNESLNVMCMVILGGKGSVFGAMVGASILTSMPEILRPVADYRLLLYGIIMLLFMIFRPKGVLGK